MADNRSIVRFPLPQQNAAAAHQSIVQVLTANGYRQITYTKNQGNEVVWAKGDGFWTPLQYIKLDYQPTELVVSAWVSFNMGVIFKKETALEGFYGFVPKKATKKVVEQIGGVTQAYQGTAPQA